jgi:hypothetical protein
LARVEAFRAVDDGFDWEPTPRQVILALVSELASHIQLGGVEVNACGCNDLVLEPAGTPEAVAARTLPKGRPDTASLDSEARLLPGLTERGISSWYTRAAARVPRRPVQARAVTVQTAPHATNIAHDRWLAVVNFVAAASERRLGPRAVALTIAPSNP